MPAWLKVVTTLVREVVIPLGGLFGVLADRPLNPTAAVIYAVMMGLLPASAIDRYLTRGSTAPSDGTQRHPPPQGPPS
jgi:hypothetical protein